MTVAEYCAAESQAEVRHEFVNGEIFSMAGASKRHNRLALRIAGEIERHLRGGPCQAFMSDMKVHIVPGTEELFYYPDIVVTCDPRDRQNTHHLHHPKLIIEVLSPATDRIDRREKLFAYLQIDTLEEYILIEQDFPEARTHHRANGWKPQVSTETLHLASIGLHLPLADIFRDLE